MYAETIVEYPVKSLDKLFTYSIPDKLKANIKVGSKIEVPFGKSKIHAIVLNIKNNKPNYETKDIIGVCNPDFYLSSEQIKLGYYLKGQTLCPLISALEIMLPSSLKINKEEHNYDLYDTYIAINEKADVDSFIKNNQRKIKQIEILNILKRKKLLKKEIPSHIYKSLYDNNLIKIEKENKFRINNNVLKDKELVLNEQQQKAYDEVITNINKYNTYLLYGVTGSGKTEVYLHLVKKVLEMGKSAIILVPEICLTTQTVKKFYQRFGSNVAVFHSGLSVGEKYDEYKKIYNDEVKIVVGTRSSIFVPLKNLGLIIIDEEHSDTYHQESTPRYDAIDIAKYRASLNNIPLILASATPSLESKARADKGVYKLLKLTKRANNLCLPTATIVDMKEENPKVNNIFSKILIDRISKCLSNNEQVILLLNRRGFSTFIQCSNCGYTYKCPNCDITLTYHKTSNKLRCHYCGYYKDKDNNCPECHEDGLNYLGLGTQKVEEEVKKFFPNARVIRMDQDTTSKKGSYQRIIDAFENHEYDILLGTQMISKGLNFKDVTLVGVINADTSLNIPDFRANEKTFSLLYQTSGRAGREKKQGNVVIQTYNPENEVLNFIKDNNYDKYYLYEMDIRHKLLYPPYMYICLLQIKSKDYELLSKEANFIKKILSEYLKEETILGPTPAGLFKVNNIYNFQIIIKYIKDNNLKEVLKKLDNKYIYNNNINIDITFNPIHF